jgi:predicted nuclease of predicted toxin-antitoxin system
MRFLVDAHLPRRLANRLKELDHDVLHTLELPDGNRTTDRRINEISMLEQRVVITKDADFVNTFLLSKVPYKLLLVSTGNIGNHELEQLFIRHLTAIIIALETYNYVEITRTSLIRHG